ncbi:hypothetical protein LOK74_14795 [Brevibacillus humidisoli]|uniref:IMEF encapsulin system ferritin-like cargo protein n=1 Tax=Brevibacillus humidisoli TaxID=2895522 RepID=UPI001E50DF93|nr:IMEF encapsulin system ferritin-like cargo protein [Brevibacillus humidisoli]UFJ39335.1 hypothetical protein LOK74_14795 [Brevibacillus humidisoli]
MEEFPQLRSIFERTKDGIGKFMSMLQPIIDNAQDEHTRLYYHHIYEEEEQRLDRLNELIPHLNSIISEGKAAQLSNRELSRLLSDINLERFGLHNFREHLELAMYEFTGEEDREWLSQMRDNTQADYLTVKEVMAGLTERVADVKVGNLVDHDEGHSIHQVDHLQASAGALKDTGSHSSPQQVVEVSKPGKKGLTVGSLRLT